MRTVYLLAATLTAFLLTSPQASAQMLLDSPACFTVYNSAPYQVSGTIATDYFTRDDGIRTRHRSNFRLEKSERNEFCTTGPFFPDWTLELTLRSLVPLFSCKTRIDMGEILIRGEILPDGSTRTSADCY